MRATFMDHQKRKVTISETREVRFILVHICHANLEYS